MAVDSTNKTLIKSTKEKAQAAVKWFVARLKDRSTKVDKIAADTVPTVGHMYLFRYDAKGKDTLPFWDAAPLVFPIEYYKDGFLGVNLHYLPPSLRSALLKNLMKQHLKGKGANQYLRLSYESLSSAAKLRAFQPCLKRYLYSHVRSKFQRIPQAEWQNAVLLPTANWQGASSSSVYKDSIGKI